MVHLFVHRTIHYSRKSLKKWKMTEKSPALKYYSCEDCRSKNGNLRAATSYWFSALQNRQYWSTADINLDRFYLKIICDFSSSIHPPLCSQSGIKKLHTSQLNTDRCVMGDITQRQQQILIPRGWSWFMVCLLCSSFFCCGKGNHWFLNLLIQLILVENCIFSSNMWLIM